MLRPGKYLTANNVTVDLEQLGKTTKLFWVKDNHKFIWTHRGLLEVVVNIENHKNITDNYNATGWTILERVDTIPTLGPSEEIKVINPEPLPFTRITKALSSPIKQQRLIAEKGLEVVELLLRKNTDYGGSVFKKPKFAPHLKPSEAILVRLSDKVERIETLLLVGKQEVEESIDDTYKDMVGYLILLQVAKELNLE